MWKLGLGIVIFPKKRFRTALSMWTCTQLISAKYYNLLRKTKLQNAYSPHIPHSGEKKKPAAWQSWTSLHVLSWTQSANPEGTWVTNGDHGGTTRNRVIPSSAHTECTDCSFMKWKCLRKIKCELGVLSHFFPERGVQKNRPLHLDIENCSLRFSVIGYYGSLAFTAFTCLSTTDPCISLCGDVRESV